MQYVKKVLVLKQVEEEFSNSTKPISAIVRIEAENGVADAFISCVNFCAKNGEYVCYLLDSNKKLFSINLGKKPSTKVQTLKEVPCLENGFCAGIFYVASDLPTLTAFACPPQIQLKITEFKKLVIDDCQTARKNRLKLEEDKNTPKTPPLSIEREDNNQIDPASKNVILPLSQTQVIEEPTLAEPNVLSPYNDEVVATENYFTDIDLEEKLKIIASIDNGNICTENELFNNRCQAQAEETKKDHNCAKDEASDGDFQKYSKENPYYKTVKDELKDLFLKFPEEKALSKNIPHSKWVRINYAEDKFYVVGIIFENKVEKYLCYGVPARYSKEPPAELKGYCSFIPLSLFDLKGDGYWMMFQDAVTGCSKKMNGNW